MKLRLTAPAARDLDEIIGYYVSAAPLQASRFADEIERVFARLGEHPRSSQATDMPSIRRATVNRFPYAVFYTIEASEAIVLHIRHASRRPWRE